MSNQFQIIRSKNLQHGYILPMVLVLMIALMISSASFFNRNAGNVELSGASRDYGQALLLAESGANYVMGRLSNATLAPATLAPCAAATMVGDINCDGNIDGTQAKPSGIVPTLPLALGYEFFLTADGNTITESTPGILQLVANGEARATGDNVLTQAISTTITTLELDDLFVSASVRPLLYIQSQAGLTYSANSWSAENNPEKAAIWIEVTRNPDPTKVNWFDIYINSAAQIGSTKAYLQRFVGSYKDTGLPGGFATLSESATHG